MKACDIKLDLEEVCAKVRPSLSAKIRDSIAQRKWIFITHRRKCGNKLPLVDKWKKLQGVLLRRFFATEV